MNKGFVLSHVMNPLSHAGTDDNLISLNEAGGKEGMGFTLLSTA